MKSVRATMRMWSAACLGALLMTGVARGQAATGQVTAKQTTTGAAVAAAEEHPALKVEVAGQAALALTAEDLGKMPRATATLTADGNATTYEGVLLYDLIAKAGWQFGRGMTGKGMASYLIATAKDGYQVVFALAEIDPMFAGEKVIVADKADGAELPGPQLPFRLVVPGDKMHARSIYSVVKIEVVRLRQ